MPVHMTILRTQPEEGKMPVYSSLVFECFHDAWEWIKENAENFYACTNPTLHPNRNETPTAERAERLIRYANYILS